MILVAVPIKPFGVAKARLSSVLDRGQRSRLGRAVAARTAHTAAEAGAEVVVVTPDDGVAAWAKSSDIGVLREDSSGPGGLNAAAGAAARHATGMGIPWVIVHADLPLATADELRRVFNAAIDSSVLIPSYDGGTNVIGGRGHEFRFSFGSGSFHRHLARSPGAAVLTPPGLVLDLDTPRDLALVRGRPEGRWLDEVLQPDQIL